MGHLDLEGGQDESQRSRKSYSDAKMHVASLDADANNKFSHISSAEEQDDRLLQSLGYKPELHRFMGFFTNFGTSFSIISILTGLGGLYTQGFMYGGPVVITWGWLLCATITLCVAASMAEICSAFPASGGVYLWTYKLAAPRQRAFASWMVGWLNLTGEAAVTAGATYTFATILAQIIQLSLPEGSTFNATQPHMLLLYYGLMLLTSGIVNTFSIKLIATMDGTSVVWHVAGTVIFAVVLLVVAPTKQSASYVFTHFNNAEGSGIESPAYVFMLGFLMTMWTISGYEVSGKMSEESVNANKVAPWGIFMAVAVSGVLGFVFLLALTFSIQDPDTLLDPTNATGGTFVVGQIVLDAFAARGLSKAGAIAILYIPLVATVFCSMNCVTGNSRTLYAFARDKAMPGHRWIANVKSFSQSPIMATWLMVLAAFILGLPMLGSTVAFSAITSLSTIGLYISYAVPIFFRAINGHNTFKPGPFNLGKFGVPIAIIAVLWVAFLTVLFVLPTTYPVAPATLNYAGVITGTVLLASLLGWVFGARKWFDGPNTI